MNVGFLSIGKKYVDEREAEIALFDSGYDATMFMTIVDEKQIEWAYSQMRLVCDALVVEGDTETFYSAMGEEFASKPASYERDGKIFGVTDKATDAYLCDEFIPMLNGKSNQRYDVVTYKTYGKTVDELKTILKDFTKKRSRVAIGYYPLQGEVEVHVRCSNKLPKAELNELSDKLFGLLDGCSYASGRVTIAERVAQMLIDQKLKLKIAESFTGGALASALTAIPGASKFLEEGLVTYTVRSKIRRLGIPPQSIAEYGVVSGETAYNMATGLLMSGDCDVVVSTTGNAGPTVGGNGAVGHCYIGYGNKYGVGTPDYLFDGDRAQVIESGVKTALFRLYEYLRQRQAMLDQNKEV